MLGRTDTGTLPCTEYLLPSSRGTAATPPKLFALPYSAALTSFLYELCRDLFSFCNRPIHSYYIYLYALFVMNLPWPWP
jgi:hypothetical protein